MRAPLTLDGVTYEHVHIVSLKRSFSVLDGSNSGRVLSGGMDRDIIGTFYNYTIDLEADGTEESIREYDELYEILSAPKESYSLTTLYAQSAITFQAYMTSGEDSIINADDNVTRWGGLSINFVAMEPKRRPA